MTNHTGSGVFLVMDDEPRVLETVSDMIDSFGYSVVRTRDGKQAVDHFKNETGAGRPIAGMLFDLTIPGGVGGKEAIHEIRKINREIPVFVASGYSEDPIMANPHEYGFTASICKPFGIAQLADMLNRFMKPKSGS